MKFVEQLEKDYDCASICQVPLFYATKNLSAGQPTQECLQALIDSVSSSVGVVGVIALITGLVSLVGFIGSFPLCTKYNDEEDTK